MFAVRPGVLIDYRGVKYPIYGPPDVKSFISKCSRDYALHRVSRQWFEKECRAIRKMEVSPYSKLAYWIEEKLTLKKAEDFRKKLKDTNRDKEHIEFLSMLAGHGPWPEH